jgi:predicted nucleic acid-binding protein
LKVYADTSFIVSFYLSQSNSPVAAIFMQRHGTALPFTPWHRLEVRNAIRMAAFYRHISPPEVKTQLKQLDLDLQGETLVVHTPIDWVATLRGAERLAAAHNESIGCRSGDLFHVAAAIELGASHFLTFDDRQRRMAQAAGLTAKI